MESVVVLKNTQPRLIHLPSEVKRMKSSSGEVTMPLYNGKPIPPSAPREKDDPIVYTKVDGAYWDRIRTNKTVQSWMKLGWLVVVDADDPSAGLPDTLAKYNTKTATTLVDGETNVALLQEWSASETRDEVKASLSRRIEHLTSAKRK